MGVLKRFFGKKTSANEKEKKALPWQPLTTTEEVDALIRRSGSRPQLLFKHSSSCGISGMVLRMFETSFEDFEAADMHFLDLHRYRQVSHAVAERTGVPHQSPQLLILKNGKVVAAASHGAILEIDPAGYL